MNDILLANLVHRVLSKIHLTWITISQVLVLALFYNTQLELAEQVNRSVTHQVFGQ